MPKPITDLITGPITIDPADPEVRSILSWTCIDCGDYGRALRKAGYEIPPKIEAEQSVVLLWFLSLYRDHGDDWRKKGAEKLRELLPAQPTTDEPDKA